MKNIEKSLLIDVIDCDCSAAKQYSEMLNYFENKMYEMSGVPAELINNKKDDSFITKVKNKIKKWLQFLR